MSIPSQIEIESLAYLWDGSEPGWGLDQFADGGYLIMREPDNMALIIEDDELNAAVIKRMLEAGVRVMQVMPDPVRLKAYQQIGAWVHSERLRRGWSPKQLGGKLRLKPQRLVDFEQGQGADLRVAAT